MWQSREIGRKLFATDESFPGFSSATTLACRQIFGIFLVSVQLLKKRSSQSRALGPNCLISSVWMSSRPGALLFFSTSDAHVEFRCSKCSHESRVVRVSLSSKMTYIYVLWETDIPNYNLYFSYSTFCIFLSIQVRN